jgi:hypothetical protein
LRTQADSGLRRETLLPVAVMAQFRDEVASYWGDVVKVRLVKDKRHNALMEITKQAEGHLQALMRTGLVNLKLDNIDDLDNSTRKYDLTKLMDEILEYIKKFSDVGDKPDEDHYVEDVRQDLKKYYLDKAAEVAAKDAFKKRGSAPYILIVCDKLLTGFDAPAENVMYLDKPLKEHSLLQAIARTNRVEGPEKRNGLIVDYKAQGNVADFHAKIKAAYSKLSDEDINLYEKQRDQFFVKLQEKQNVSKADAEVKLQDMEKSCGCGSAKAA